MKQAMMLKVIYITEPEKLTNFLFIFLLLANFLFIFLLLANFLFIFRTLSALESNESRSITSKLKLFCPK